MLSWTAYYKNGIAIKQSEQPYHALDRNQVDMFDIEHDGRVVVRLDLREDELGKKKLLWRIRHSQSLGGEHRRVWLAGWWRRVGTIPVYTITYIFADGSVLVSGQFNDQDIMDSVQLLDFER